MDVYGARVESDDGVNHSRNCVAVAPRKLDDGSLLCSAGNSDNYQHLLGLYHMSDIKETRALSHVLMVGNYIQNKGR